MVKLSIDLKMVQSERNSHCKKPRREKLNWQSCTLKNSYRKKSGQPFPNSWSLSYTEGTKGTNRTKTQTLND